MLHLFYSIEINEVLPVQSKNWLIGIKPSAFWYADFRGGGKNGAEFFTWKRRVSLGNDMPVICKILKFCF